MNGNRTQLQWLFVFLCAMVFTAVHAQRLPWRQIGLQEGLPDLEIYDLFLKSDGTLWIGGQYGLYRFDGEHFSVYQHPEQLGVETDDLMEDRYGRIWCHNFSGQVLYWDGEMKMPDSMPRFHERKYPLMAMGNGGESLWVTGDTVIWELDLEDLTWQVHQMPYSDRERKPHFNYLTLDERGIVWAVGGLGHTFFFQDGEFRKYGNGFEPISSTRGAISPSAEGLYLLQLNYDAFYHLVDSGTAQVYRSEFQWKKNPQQYHADPGRCLLGRNHGRPLENQGGQRRIGALSSWEKHQRLSV